MGILLDVGTSNEDEKTSGMLLSFKQTYYKSLLNTNESINYGMVQMSGGKYEMDYDRERCWYKAQCLDHDAVDVFQMLSDCALEPKNLVAVNASIEKAKEARRFYQENGQHFLFTDFAMRHMFEGPLQNPLLGDGKAIDKFEFGLVQKFQMENVRTSGIVVAGTNVENHSEFVELADQHLGSLKFNVGDRSSTKNKSKFAEGSFISFAE